VWLHESLLQLCYETLPFCRLSIQAPQQLFANIKCCVPTTHLAGRYSILLSDGQNELHGDRGWLGHAAPANARGSKKQNVLTAGLMF